jgi:hypothetical protein
VHFRRTMQRTCGFMDFRRNLPPGNRARVFDN